MCAGQIILHFLRFLTDIFRSHIKHYLFLNVLYLWKDYQIAVPYDLHSNYTVCLSLPFFLLKVKRSRQLNGCNLCCVLRAFRKTVPESKKKQHFTLCLSCEIIHCENTNGNDGIEWMMKCLMQKRWIRVERIQYKRWRKKKRQILTVYFECLLYITEMYEQGGRGEGGRGGWYNSRTHKMSFLFTWKS